MCRLSRDDCNGRCCFKLKTGQTMISTRAASLPAKAVKASSALLCKAAISNNMAANELQLPTHTHGCTKPFAPHALGSNASACCLKLLLSATAKHHAAGPGTAASRGGGAATVAAAAAAALTLLQLLLPL